MARSTDFNIRAALKRNRQLLTGAQESGRAALAGYEKLTPEYNRAVQAARDYQGTVTSSYDAYRKAYDQGVGAFNTELQRLKGVYDSAVASVAPLKSARDAAAQQASQLYSTYSSAYESGVSQGQASYESSLKSLQASAEAASAEYRKSMDLANREARRYNNLLDNVYLSPKTYTGDVQYDLGGIGGNIYVGGSRVTISRLSADAGSGARYDSVSNLYAATPSRSEASRAFFNRGTARTYQDSVYDLYTRGKRTYEDYQSAVAEAQRISNLAAQTRTQSETYSKDAQRFLGTYQTEIGKYNELLEDTDYVTRFAQQQSTAALNTYNQYVRDTFNPAETRFRDASSSVTAAAQAYNTFAADRFKVDAAASAAKQVYDASVSRYQDLQTAYQDLEPQLTEYTRQAEAAKQQVLSLQGMTPELQRSLAIDTEARKRGTRLGYRRSVLSQDFKRRGAAR
tara:strand:- start:944 stop:2308 length:1365 start_codon:yes stop_codon:yes gene_type:complete